MARKNQKIVDEEVFFDESEQLVSITDTRGVITYANDVFCKVAGYSKEELLRKNHNIVRHPDMPKAAFQDLWKELEAGNHWQGVVKNLCKDGRYYWVNAYVTPMYEKGVLTGYQSVRVKPSNELKQKANVIYKAINENKLGISESQQYILKKSLAAFGLVALLWVIFSLGGAMWGSVSLIAMLMIFIGFYDELIVVPQYIKEEKLKFSSVCRLIYTDGGAASVLQFRESLYQARIRTILGRMNDSLGIIAQVINELNLAIENTNDKISQQNEETAQIASSMDDMSSTIANVNSNAIQSADNVDQVYQQCTTSQSLMAGSIEKIESLQANVAVAHKSSSDLVSVVNSINDQMNEIQGIADQTNLLALNAAIEAARAGEQGRGFAVVADEVRSLSSRTHTVSEGITDSVKQVTDKLAEVAQLMEDNIKTSQACADSSGLMQESSAHIYQQMLSISDLTASVSTASEQQSTVANEINHNIKRVAELAQALVDSKILSSNITLLNTESANLTAMADNFEQKK